MNLPKQIGRYPIERELGRGGMGVVYRARDPKLDRLVAIKVLSSALAEKEGELSRFEREARILARFNHPHIATIYGLEETADGRRFLVLEYIEGRSLAARLAEGPMSVDDALRVVRQIASALVAAHRRDVIHRDLKPANVLIDPEDSVKVLDFGLAKAAAFEAATDADAPTLGFEASPDKATDVFHTRAGSVMGTPSYMSPEQVRGQSLDHRSDIFALGCMLFECLTGQRAFRGGTLADVFAATLTSEPDWSALPAATPAGIRRLLTRTLEKDPSRRLADAGTAIEEIEVILGTPSSMLPVSQAVREVANNLPRSLSSFVGREAELVEALALHAESRLLTLTGSGGCGKTRLAVRLAEDVLPRFADGCWFVDLAATSDPDQVESVLMVSLGLHEEAQQSTLETIHRFLESKTLLLVLDNCEHLLSECSQLAERILGRAPNVKIIATSREALGVAGETIFLVPSLSTAAGADVITAAQLERFESVALFSERARAAKPGFRLDDTNAPFIAQICDRLDGIPLAIELAAARVRALSPEKIAERLSRDFSILTGGRRTALPRQQTLRAAFDWSYHMLGPEEQLLLRRLSVFAGGLTLEAAERVCSDDEDMEGTAETELRLADWEILDILTALVEKSLVVYDDTSDEGRYRMLEAGRQFACEMLAQSGRGEAVRTRHLDYFVALAEEAEPHLVGHGQPRWLERLTKERDNVKVALEWCAVIEDGGDKALRIVGAIWRSWSMQGQWGIGLSAMSSALARGGARSPARVKALNGAGILNRNRGQLHEARRLHDEALSLARDLNDQAGAAQALYSLAMLDLWGEGEADSRAGDGYLAGAARTLEESLSMYRALGDQRGIANALQSLGWVAQSEGDPARARGLYEETLSIRRALGDQHGTASSLCTLGLVEIQKGDLVRAASFFEESLAIFRRLGSRSGVGWAIGNLGLVRLVQNDDAAATPMLEESLAMRREVKDSRGVARTLADLSIVRERSGDREGAVDALRECLEAARRLGTSPLFARTITATALLLARAGASESAVRLHGAASGVDQFIAASLALNRRQQEESLEALRRVMDASAFGKAWDEGRALARDGAFELAQRVLGKL